MLGLGVGFYGLGGNKYLSEKYPKGAFVFTVKTDNTTGAVTGAAQFELSQAGSNNYDVDWGDDSTSTGVTADETHTYSTAGTYTITITGSSNIGIHFGNAHDHPKIIDILQYGNMAINGNGTFYNCSNLNPTATDAPIINTTDFRNQIRGCTSWTTGSVANWDVSSVENFSNWCLSASNFLGNGLDTWDIRSATSATSFMNAGGLTQANYDALLIQWDTLSGYPTISLDFGSTNFSAGAAAAARTSLTEKGITFSDGGEG